MSFEGRGLQWFRVRENNYNSVKGKLSLAELKADIPHCNICYFDVTVTVNGTANTAVPLQDVDRVAGIAYAKQQGYKIVMRVRGKPRNVAPSNPALFFQNYTAAVLYWADIAEQYKVDFFLVGVEYTVIEANAYTAYWLDLIDEVRQHFSGLISYTTNNHASQAEFNRKMDAEWFKELDTFLGLSCYWKPILRDDFAANYPYPETPSVERLKEGYYSSPIAGIKGWSIPDTVKQLSERHGKKILFHAGIGSWHGACVTPWVSRDVAQYPIDLLGQANWWRMFFEIFGGEPYVYGVLGDGAWLTTPKADKDPNNREFSIQGKPSMQVVADAFRDLTPTPPPPPGRERVLEPLVGAGAGLAIGIVTRNPGYVVAGVMLGASFGRAVTVKLTAEELNDIPLLYPEAT